MGLDDPSSSSTDPSGLRRRHSTHHEPEDVRNNDLANAQRRTSLPVATEPSPFGTDLLAEGSFRTSAHSTEPRENPSGDGESHVRFSSDIERASHANPGPNEPFNGHVTPRKPSLRASTSGLKRPGTPTLSVDTSGASSSSGIDHGATWSLGSQNASSTSPPGLPSSPRTRNRGFSLRRSLFSTRLSANLDGANSPIELDEPGPSNGPQSGPTVSVRSSGKKEDQTVVTVTSAHDHDLSTRLNNETSAFKGVSALPHYENLIREKAQRNATYRRLKDVYTQTREFILRINEIPASKDGRHIVIDATRKTTLVDERTEKPYIGNIIRSARYNAWNFLPRQLLAQFSKLANFYFLCVSILQMIPGLSTTGTYTTIVPLIFFVSLSMAKEGYDDLRRTRLDKEENNRETSVLIAEVQKEDGVDLTEETLAAPNSDSAHWANKKWENVQVGDIVKLDRDQAAPADIVLLNSTGDNGVAYIETMALDGETNLKSKQALAAVRENCNTTELLAVCNAELVVEDPNLDLYNFEGKVTIHGQTLPLSNSEVVYRGSILRNTPEAIGLVIYSGEECKIRMNANKNPRIKAPSLQSVVNKIVIVIVVFVLALAIFNTIAYQIWSRNFEEQAWYISNAEVAFGPIIVSFIIMFNTMIPLSLYVSLEIIKVCQMVLLNDVDMYDEASDTPLEARTSTINEELGQVSYVFSDKTGTLTDNSMKFRKISVAGTAWLHDPDLKEDALRTQGSRLLMHKKRSKGKRPLSQVDSSGGSEPRRRSTGFTSTPAVEANPSSPGWGSTARPKKPQLEHETSQMLRYIQRKPFTVFAKKARFFLLSIALCHSCLPELKDDDSINFQATSPDELALVEAARELGYLMIDRQSGVLTIKTFPQGFDADPSVDSYEILDVIEFSSKRKRMSIIVKLPDQRICVIAKGADSTMMQLLRLSALAIQKNSEIEQRAGQRKSMEAQQAMKRKENEQVDNRKSFSSPVLGRRSLGGFSMGNTERTSLTKERKNSLRDQVDTWLNERERDVDASPTDNGSIYYSPRPSGYFGRRSGAASEALSSPQGDYDEDLVEEALAIDEPAIIERCFQHINDFATEGLRTLMYGYRFLEREEYQSWKKIYHDATTSLVDRQNMIEKAANVIEKDFELAGATAIEDKLQRGVPETIDKLRRASIKMWMLTGDKRETAINIGHSCRLIKDYSSVTILDHETGTVESNIASSVLEINNGTVAHSVVVVDGQTLSLIESDKSLNSLFLDLAIIADSVICCRASPSQKAGLVKAIRHKVNRSVTLAIGDGANDIAMIQEAHVGVGITGKEGLQAARVSDYSIAQFRFLSKLLLVHGRWNYIRTCKYTVATFWKEMMFYLTQALYQRSVGYTGTSYYESWSLSMFNTLFTSLPVILLGIFEKDLLPATLLAVPELYTKGQRNGGFNYFVYLWWMFLASAEAMILYYGTVSLFAPSASADGVGDIFPMGDLTFTAVVIFISAKLLGLEMHNLSIVNAIGAFLSVGGWFLWNILLSIVYGKNTIYDVKKGFLIRFGDNFPWWLTLILIVAAVLTVELTFKALKAAFKPSDTDVFQQLEKDLPTRMRFEEAAAMELQNGWNRGKKKSSAELAAEEAEEVRRQAEVADLLKNRDFGIETEVMNNVATDTMERLRNRQRTSEAIELEPSRGAASMDGRRRVAFEEELSPLEIKRSRSAGNLASHYTD